MAVRMSQSYDRWQGDEGSYLTFATRVAEGNAPYVDWSPGFVLLYSPIVAAGFEGADAVLAVRVLSSGLLLAIFGFAANRILGKTWLALILTLALVAHPMLSVGMSLRVLTAAIVALVLLVSTNQRRGVGWALIVLAAATLVRPEFWILYILALVAALFWYRQRTTRPLIAASIAIGFASWAFVQLGPVGSNYPGGRVLQAVGQHYAVFDATPGVDPWNEWHVPFERDFGDATTPLQMYRNNEDRFTAYVSSNLRLMPDLIVRTYRFSDRLMISRAVGILIVLMILAAGLRFLASTPRSSWRISFTVLISILTFSMVLPWIVTGTDSMLPAPFSPSILVLAGISAVFLYEAVARRRQLGVTGESEGAGDATQNVPRAPSSQQATPSA